MKISIMNELQIGLNGLVELSLSEGFNFLKKMEINWNEGKNTFNREGEVFFGVFDNDVLIGCGGLNIDPYIENNRIGRVRHLYVHPEYRRKGIAKELMMKIEKHAQEGFSLLRLRTFNPSALQFYKELGSGEIDDEYATHCKQF